MKSIFLKIWIVLFISSFFVGCDFEGGVLGEPKQNFNQRAVAPVFSVTLDQEEFEAGNIMTVFCSGLDASREYKVTRFNLETGLEVGQPRTIKGQTSTTRRFRIPPKGKYRVILTEIPIAPATVDFTVGIVDPDPDPDPDLHKVKFEILTDKYPDDNSWALLDDAGTVINQGPKGFTYEANKLYSTLMQVKDGNYYLEIYDKGGDGLPSPAYAKLRLDGEELYKGSRRFDDPNNPWEKLSFGKLATIKFRAGPNTKVPDEREQLYLDEHNRHRKIASEKEGLQHIPLRWSFTVEKEAQRWADYLVRNGKCNLEHESPSPQGENLAARTGNANPRPVDGVVQSWVNSSGHYSQLKWRGSRYMGCGEAYGDNCSVQACRFISPGNCNGYDNWIEDYTACGVICPPEGCFSK